MIDQRLKALDTNAFAFERSHGLPADAVRSVLRGNKKSGTTLNRAQQLCDALGIELYIGPPRSDDAEPKASPDEQRNAILWFQENFGIVKAYEADMSAGGGSTNSAEVAASGVAFRRDWLKRLGISPDRACLVRVKGDSMEPGLHDGDSALIDQSRTSIRTGHVYAFNDVDGSTRVKRLEVVDKSGVALRSDNPEYKLEYRMGYEANRLSVIGQVVWSGHVWR
ncbi:S24 family peptidase [Frigidibacter oleivorans]|uniref:S24 family peptidase n=1 Tax=Frigidibacter oleivorans TaxID=2487129 RepID=UPI000F8C8742|nr:S24 family peptidase [Frigidibacter oleivorans]